MFGLARILSISFSFIAFSPATFSFRFHSYKYLCGGRMLPSPVPADLEAPVPACAAECQSAGWGTGGPGCASSD